MKRIAAAAVSAAILALPGSAAAQLHVGAQASFAADRLDDSQAGLGARLALGAPLFPLELHGNADYFFTDCGEDVDCSYWRADASLIWRLASPGIPLKPFVGVGLTHQRLSVGDSDLDGTGTALIGGVELGATPVIRPFLEVRWEIIDEGDEANELLRLDNQFSFSVGIIL